MILVATLLLRLVNPNERLVEAKIVCGARSATVAIAGHDLVDVVSPCDGEDAAMTIDSSAPLLALEATPDSQRVVGNAECHTELSLPLYGCKRGTVTAAVPEFAGASYNWSIEGANLVSGAGTNRLTIALTDAPQAKVTCVIVRPECTSTATGVISVRDPLLIASFTAPSVVDAKVPVQLEWTYGTSLPASQLLTGDAFAAPVVLPADQRSYTFVPANSGQRHVELRASYAPAVAQSQNPSGKRRSAGKSVTAASDCPDTKANATIEVRGCAVPVPDITAPSTAEVGSTFDASVSVSGEDTVTWTVTGGIIVNDFGHRIRIRADQEGSVSIGVKVDRGGACFAESSLRVRIDAKPPECQITPTVRVELIGETCDTGTIRATFTGRAPFRGTWSDGSVFHTQTDTLTREVTTNGDWAIREFRDGAGCFGAASNVARFEKHAAKAVLSVTGGNCTNAKITVRFTGVPPFEGKLYKGDYAGEWFKTNATEMVIQPELIGRYWIDGVSDAMCPRQTASNSIEIIGDAPVLETSTRPACAFYPEQPPQLFARFNWGPPPYTIYWADGAVTRSNDNALLRQVPLPTQPLEYYDITRATTGNCEAVIPNKHLSATFRVQPRIDNNLARNDFIVCPGKTGSTHLTNTLPSNATVRWTVESGEIVSGQGTSTVSYRQVSPAQFPLLKATATYPDDACSSFDQLLLYFPGDPVITDLVFDPPTISAGGTSTLSFKGTWLSGVGWSVDPIARYTDLSALQCTNYATSCLATYHDTHGAGTVKVTLSYSGECTTSPKTTSVNLTIVP
jgi:hypothetical protein